MSSGNEANYFSGNNLWAGSILNVHYTDAMKWSIKTVSQLTAKLYIDISQEHLKLKTFWRKTHSKLATARFNTSVVLVN